MNKYSSLKIKENELAISSQFNNWLERDRGRQVRGIGRFLKMRSNLTDSILTSVWKIEGLADEPDLGLFSVGGYGRGELHPFSDIDLLVLSKTNLNKEKQKLIEKFISHLWDLGFDLGHSVRSILDSRKQAAADIRTMTNMLETRFIAGDKAMKIELYNIREHKSLWPGASFFHAKENEQIERHLIVFFH